MSYTFKLDHEHEVIEADYAGLVTFEERMQAIKEGIAIMQDREFPRILINLVGAKMQISKQEKIELSTYVSEQYALIKAKTAFLISHEQLKEQAIEDVVTRTDEFMSHVFYNRSKALGWLSGEP